ncbi:hypothetical protein [Pseudoalteromonas luteoviolacea]|uniref:Uncharacterized protein n=1 Tax=Pseudoalteromonas luteoviolacea (strain 2ta16) TaxID=1353533 RepID=V4I3L9_PSEL2|nr:hypothetical protein [Pseudoalteromonas luteoviolacea]ESP94804.1 hypothetical protein PL2TA16_00804 [Pseudoalteromonas luteoviolacea 2ta16]KZN43330.1 hypothetical protein N483_08535 [Pseudoalteromonas luteoviolacea NCIMB 1944]
MNSISTLNQNRIFQAQQNTAQHSIEKHAQFASLMQDALNPKPTTTDPDLVMPVSLNTNYEEISEQAKAYYERALENAKEYVNPDLDERSQAIQLYQETTIGLMDMPIEVEIEQHEINEALLFGSLGIDFLKYKELGVRIEMLDLMEQDINNSTELLASDKEKLIAVIDEKRSMLEMQREEMLSGTYIEEEQEHRKALQKRFDSIDFSK